ncbi:hypothetical protein ABT272_42685 [Streptomyces sp900105245]|uniref:Uncharacterized protein n=1 Tax=Streptomyces sp. 900105245 TaxID=3154379 RepID=A0ABV1UKQ0_9ACTN
MITLPGAMDSAVVSCAEVLIEDAEAWAQALDALGARLDFEEVHEVLLQAWQTAAELLPDVLGEPSDQRWAAAPTIELRLSCERPDHTAVIPALADFLDLTPLGPSCRAPRSNMTVTITADPGTARTRRQDVLRRALVHIAHAFGHIHAKAGLV